MSADPVRDVEANIPRRAGTNVVQITAQLAPNGEAQHYWRVSAANGRVLGRSSTLFPDQRAAGANLRMISSLVASLTLTVEHAAGPGWTWRLHNPRSQDLHTACCAARIFERQGSCRRAGQRMLLCLGELHHEFAQPPTDPLPRI